MRIHHLDEGVGRIVKGVNTTVDVGPNQTSIEAAKFGNTVDKDGVPPTLSSKVKGKSTNVLFNLGLTEGIRLKLERDKHMDVLHIWDTKEKHRVEVRGKKGYETNGYDPQDKLHQVLDRVGRAASVSDLMNGDVVDINPHHPQGARAIRTAQDVLTTEDAPRYTAAEWAIIEGGHSLEEPTSQPKKPGRIFEALSEYELEDRHPNEKPYGPEFKPTMPQGTIRVKVTDVYDWYKLGQHISDLANIDPDELGKGPPQAVISFGSEEEEHKYVDLLQKLGLEIIDIDPGPPDAKGVKGSKTYSNESIKTEGGMKRIAQSSSNKADRMASNNKLQPGLDTFKKKPGVEIDNRDGWGAVPWNQEVDYRGLRVKMKPSVFINLAASRNGEPPVPKVVDYVKDGGAIGAPFLQIFVEEDDSQIPEVRGHEGRSRMAAILEVHGDIPVETHLFFQGKVNRNRHITPEFVEKIQRYLISENDKMVRGPLFEI